MESNISNDFYINNISKSNITIYNNIEIGDPMLWIPSDKLEEILQLKLKNLNLEGLPLRTRSKIVKEEVSSALGYPVPKSFKKNQP